MGHWRLGASDPFALFSALCAPPRQGVLSFTGASLRRTTLQIRMGGRGKGERVGGPLFSGELRARRLRSQADFHTDAYSLALRLSLNPTRYVAHQISRRFAGISVDDWSLPSPAMFRRRVVRSTKLETVLDGNDNVLLSGAAQAHGRPEAWTIHLHRYWTGLIHEIEEAFALGSSGSGVPVQRVAGHLNLRSVETYWEFADPDPIALVKALEPHLFQVGSKAEARSFDYAHGERVSGRDQSARFVRVRLRAGVQLRVYAKTTGRVRFEIRHELPKMTGKHYIPHTASDDADFFRWLDILASKAADEVNSVLGYLERVGFSPAGSLPPYNLIRRVAEAVPDRLQFDAALSLLINDGVMVVGPLSPLREMARALVRSEVLVRQGRNRFVVAPLFRQAVAELRAAQSGSSASAGG